MTGLYIHIPFCVRKCPYCDFYSIPFTETDADDYVEAGLRAMGAHPFPGLRADTLYLGGGTPILLGPGRLGRILEAARKVFHLPDTAEITMEANPAASMAGDLRALRQSGFNRISFGVQSLHDSELAALGRLHSAAEAEAAILAAAEAGFGHISADLMLAIPGQTAGSLDASIEGLAALPIEHISAYLLGVEEGTVFAARYGGEPTQKGAPSLPDEDATADFYLQCVERLAAHGFAQYEISNFAKNGAVSLHNGHYWRCGEYLGIGPGAHSYLDGRRFYFPRDLAAFVAAPQPFDLTVDDGPGGGAEEALLLGLRLTEGVDLANLPLTEAARERILQRARGLEAGGLTRVEGSRVALTVQGFLLSNSVIAQLLMAIS